MTLPPMAIVATTHTPLADFTLVVMLNADTRARTLKRRCCPPALFGLRPSKFTLSKRTHDPGTVSDLPHVVAKTGEHTGHGNVGSM